MSEVRSGEVINARWEILSALGEGTSGEVFRARDRQGGPEVALKLLHAGALRGSDARRRFEREARALSGLLHAHVVGALEIGEHGAGSAARPYLVMELLSGPSLESLIARERLSPHVALTLAHQILAGLAHAHELGLVHRDIKPGNVVVHYDAASQPIARLVDFGLVRFADLEVWGEQSVLTGTGAMLGTPAYMSPEHAFGPIIDARSDVYSAGVVLFELLTGTWPFVAEAVPDVLRAHALDPVPSLMDARQDLEVKPELDALIQRAMAKKPADRFADAGEMKRALWDISVPAAWLAR